MIGIKGISSLFAREEKRILSDEILNLIKRSVPDKTIQEKLQSLYLEASDIELWYMQAYALADEWKVNPKELLESFILASSNGLLELRWIHHCPSCNASMGRYDNMHEIPSDDHCDLCDLDFVNSLDETVEVSFLFSSQFVKYKKSLQNTFNMEMMKEVKKTGSFDPKVKKVSGKDCLNIPLFKSLFGDDILTQDQSMLIRHLPILFTDIKSSTEMYDKYGDVRLYKAVRAHFEILFDVIKANDGIVVKTIGDAVMASFPKNFNALNAALEGMKRFPYHDPSGDFTLDVKFGLHAGPCIAVNLNNQMDYFGTTVNIAARIQGLAKAGELILSEAMFSCEQCKTTISNFVDRVSKKTVEIRGLKEPIVSYKVTR